MNAIVIEHVPVAELPPAWRAKLAQAADTLVTVRIEEERIEPAQTALADNPLFGMWRNREETADVAAFTRELRAPRYNVEGSRRED